MKPLLSPILLAALALSPGLAACASRIPQTLQNTPSPGVVVMRTQDASFYGLWSEVAYRYWRCTEEGDTLVCRRDCDSDSTDLVCPAFLGADLFR